MTDNPSGTANEARTFTCKVRDGSERSFSTFEDLKAAYLEAGGALDDEFGVRSEALYKWLSQGQIGCVFAQILAKKHSEVGWNTVSVSTDSNLANSTNEHIRNACEQGADALQIIVKNASTAEDAVNLVNLLCRDEQWYWEEIPWALPKDSDCAKKCLACSGNFDIHNQVDEPPLLVGLRHRLDNGFIAWVLGLAPFEPMPVTRRFVGADFTVLELRTGLPLEPQDPDDIRGPGREVHLCDMNSTLLNDELYAKIKKKTNELKSSVLNEDKRCLARAKVTFAVPQNLRTTLCGPWGGASD